MGFLCSILSIDFSVDYYIELNIFFIFRLKNLQFMEARKRPVFVSYFKVMLNMTGVQTCMR